MIEAILSFSIRYRWLVILACLATAILGGWNFARLPIDAVPDITNVQVQINSRAPGYSPLEVERRITFPLETALGGLPLLENTRSLSRYGISQDQTAGEDEGRAGGQSQHPHCRRGPRLRFATGFAPRTGHPA